jgi:hypothetical protein
MLQGRWLQDNDDKGGSVLPSQEYWLVLYLQEKEKEGAYDAPPLLCFETNNDMVGMVCSQHFLLHE